MRKLDKIINMLVSVSAILIAYICVSGVTTTIFANSCSGRCDVFTPGADCQCNTACQNHGDCCSDYSTVCQEAGEGSCTGRCDQYLRDEPCQCNTACLNYDNCCHDYWPVCRSGGLVTGVAQLDVNNIVETLWQNDINRATSSDVTIDIQGQVSYNGNQDRAQRPLFTYVNPSLFNKPTYATFTALLNNYIWDTRHTDSPTISELREIEAFLDAILDTRVMAETDQFLRNENLLSGGSGALRDVLTALWFASYSRTSGGAVSSSGFEHVFVGELSSSSISGLHSWIQVYLLEAAGDLDYQGYVRTESPDVFGAQIEWHSYRKMASFFLHASPELEIALYTICLLTNPGPRVCQTTLDGQEIDIQTWDVNHVQGLQIGTGYPRI